MSWLNTMLNAVAAIGGWEGMKWIDRRIQQHRRNRHVDRPCA